MAPVVVLLTAWGCGERAANVQEPLDYRKAGLSFQYPGNWKVTQDMKALGTHHLTVDSPGNAIMIIHIFPVDGDESKKLKAYVDDFSDLAKAEAPAGSFGPSAFTDPVREGRYESITERFSVSVPGQAVPHVRTYRRAVVGEKVCFLIAQVAEEDLAKVQPGFEQICKSFRYTASPEKSPKH